MNLHEFRNNFLDAIQATSQALAIREVYIEKDYWVTLALRRLAESQYADKIVFKGGTSLSKAYRIIKRFSEDVDLAVLQGEITNSQVEKIIERVAKQITSDPFSEVFQAGVTSKKGLSRITLHSYPRYIAATNFGAARDKLLLEVNCFGKPSPFQKMPVRSMIGDFLVNQGNLELLKQYNLDQFEVQVLDLRITFLEKVLSLVYASFEDKDSVGKEVIARMRHFYDLANMFNRQEIQDFFNGEDAKIKLSEIRAEEKLGSRAKWTDRSLTESILFSDTKKTLDEVEESYFSAMRDLVFAEGDVTEFSIVRKAIEKTVSSLSGI